MIILGIDPGTARMGYGVIEINKVRPKLIKSDTLVTDPGLMMEKRLMFLYKNLKKIAKDFSPDVMALERLFFNTNAKTAISVGQARGVSMLTAAETDIPIFEYTALQAKRELTGYGRAKKKEMQEAVREYLGLGKEVKSDDANDAVAIALCFVKKDYKDFLKTFNK